MKTWTQKTAQTLALASILGAAALSASLPARADDNDYRGRSSRSDSVRNRASNPPGWDRGRKTGWNDHKVPLGQSARRDRDRWDNDRDWRDNDRNDRDSR